MRGRGLAILAVVVVALAAFVWFYERDLPGTAEREARANRLLQLEADEVVEVILEGDGRRVRLAGEPAAEEETAELFAATREWRLVEPMTARADRLAVEGLVDELVGLEKRRELEGGDRQEYGLEPPGATATLITDGGQRRVIELGRELPAGAGRVVAVDRDPRLYVVSETVFGRIVREPGEWRSRELFPAPGREIERVRLTRGERTLLLARRGEDFWLEAPVADLAERELAEGLVGALTGLRAERFVDEPPEGAAELGLDPPWAMVEAVLAGRSEPFRVELGGAAEEAAPDAEEPPRYLRADGQVAVGRTGLREHLTRDPGEWRSRRWTSMRLYQIEGVRVVAGDDTLELTREGADWRRGEDTLLYGAVSDLLASFTESRAERLLAPGEAAAAGIAVAEPSHVITLTANDGRQETLEVFAAAAGVLPVRASGREVVLLMPAELGDELDERLQAVRQAEPLTALEEGA